MVANVVEWLAVVGLHRYAHIFRQHRVDGERLAQLTSDMLLVCTVYLSEILNIIYLLTFFHSQFSFRLV